MVDDKFNTSSQSTGDGYKRKKKTTVSTSMIENVFLKQIKQRKCSPLCLNYSMMFFFTS